MITIGCGSGSGVYVVDGIEDGVARLENDRGEAVHRRLELKLREGDVIVDGRVDEEARATNLKRVQAARAQLGVKRAGSFDLERPHSKSRLTADPE